MVHGAEYELPPATDDQLCKSVQIASTYALNFLPARAQGPHLDGAAALTIRLRELRDQLSRSAAEGRALADAGATHLGEERFRRDITQLRALGSLDELIRWHNVRHQVDGMNPERIRKWLPADRDTQQIIQMCEDGVVADTDPNFVRTQTLFGPKLCSDPNFFSLLGDIKDIQCTLESANSALESSNSALKSELGDMKDIIYDLKVTAIKESQSQKH